MDKLRSWKSRNANYVIEENKRTEQNWGSFCEFYMDVTAFEEIQAESSVCEGSWSEYEDWGYGGCWICGEVCAV